MEYIGIEVSWDSKLHTRSIYPIRIRSEKWDIFERPFEPLVNIQNRSNTNC